jgi:hypothetical protein
MTPLLRSIVTRATLPSSTSCVNVEKVISRGAPGLLNWLNTKMPRMMSITISQGLNERLTRPPGTPCAAVGDAAVGLTDAPGTRARCDGL